MRASILLGHMLLLLSLTASMSCCATSSFVIPPAVESVRPALVMPTGIFAIQLNDNIGSANSTSSTKCPAVMRSSEVKRSEIDVNNCRINDRSSEAAHGAYANFMISANKQRAPNLAIGVNYTGVHVATTSISLGASAPRRQTSHIRPTTGTRISQPNNISVHRANLLGMVFGSPEHVNVVIGSMVHTSSVGRMVGITLRQPITSNIGLQVGIGMTSTYFAGMTFKFGGK